VPVTAKLSRKFYETLGDDVAGELVDWFNAVDATYKSELKETNELNWERFKATLHEETSSLRAELHESASSLRAELHEAISSLRAELRGEMAALRSDIRAEMKAMQADLMKWMFIYWSGTVAAIIGMGYFGLK